MISNTNTQTSIPTEFFGKTEEDILNICLKSDFPGTDKWEANHPIWNCNVAGRICPRKAWDDKEMLKKAIHNLFYILHKSINVGPRFYPEFADAIEKTFNGSDRDICRVILNRFTIAKLAPKVTALRPNIFTDIIEESGVDLSCGVYCPMAGFGGIIEGSKRWFKKRKLPVDVEAYDINENFCNYYGWMKRDVLAQVIKTDKIVIACPPFGENTERWEGTPDNMYYSFDDWCKLIKEHIIAKNYILIGPEITNNTTAYKTGVTRPSLFRKKIGIQLYREHLK